MAIKILKCPNCGASVEVNSDYDYCLCKYCGAKISADNLETEPELDEEQLNIQEEKNRRYTIKWVSFIISLLVFVIISLRGMKSCYGGIDIYSIAWFVLSLATFFVVLYLIPEITNKDK